MVALVSLAYLLVAAIGVSGTSGIFDFEDRRFLKHPHIFPPWECQRWPHRFTPECVYAREHYHYSDSRGLRFRVLRPRLDQVSVRAGAVTPDVGERTVVLKQVSRVQPLKAEAVHDDLAANRLEAEGGERNSTSIGSNEEAAARTESRVEANENGTSREEVKSEATDPSTAEETGSTASESWGVEETTTPSVSDKVEDGISETSLPTTTVAVKETVAIVHSTVDHSFPKEVSPSGTTSPSTAVTVSGTVSSTPSTPGDSSSKEISPSNTPLPSSAGTASETASSTPSAAGDSSSEGRLSSKTPLPSSVVTTIETVPSTPGDIVSPSKTPLPSSTVTVSEAASSTPTAGDTSSSSSAVPVTERVIVLPRVRSARIVLSSVLLAIGLVAVAVAAVCIFRERRRKLKYDQLKLLP